MSDKVVERKGKYVLSGPSGGYDWWTIGDTEKEYELITVQSIFPNAEEIIRFAWNKITE